MENKIKQLANKEEFYRFEQSLTKTIYITTILKTLIIIASFATIVLILKEV